MSETIRVRFAPSPTGFLHIGGVRTALFNFLFARNKGGAFLLRIEDTDRERSRPEFEAEILDALSWLGLKWDGAVLRQSQRLQAYQSACDQLLKAHLAYPVQEGSRSAVKLRSPRQSIRFDDLVHGSIEFPGERLEDFVILKSDGFPTYHFACVVDDHDMGITHVIRGDDHISNTPKQLQIYEAFGWKPPQHAHLPLVFGQDRTPLSKRHGAVALRAYREEGYLPEGLLNYLALLGWSPGRNQEIFSLPELIGEFKIENINKTNACFDPEKLKWLNGEHIRRLTDSDYVERLQSFLGGTSGDTNHFQKIALLYKTRIQTFHEFRQQTAFFFMEEVPFDAQAVRKHLSSETVQKYVTEWHAILSQSGDFSDPKALEALLRQTAERFGIEAAPLIHATRVAISGRSVTPGLFEVMVLLGREVVLKRIQYAIIHFDHLPR